MKGLNLVGEWGETQLEIVSQLYTFLCFPSWSKLCSCQSPVGIWSYVYVHVEYFDLHEKATTLWLCTVDVISSS